MDYYKAFFVGLWDGNGSIQVNHWRYKTLQYRIVLKLKNTENNLNMLQMLQLNLNFGYIYIDNKNNFVLFIINNKSQIKKCLNLLSFYKPLTKRINYQILFMKNCLIKNDLNWYFVNRNLKYNINLEQINYNTFYFKGWLSGFIEAEGCFTLCVNSSKSKSFSIAQKDEKFLFEFIANFFDSNLNVRCNKLNIYSIEIYKKTILNVLKNHFFDYPLLGEKKINFDCFYNNLK